ncbi:MAG TPA: hypothetical protein VFW33_08485 [Gemmataceae bacterium]|nr:hypothetical protein [Gemmataceae bacterium]
MRLVLAGCYDAAARALVERWGPARTALVTPADLSRPGWAHSVGPGGADGAAVVGGRVLAVDELDGVVVRIAAVPAGELGHVRAEDRAYAAAEMTAFLLAWLDACPGPVVNRPTPGCLNGPPWREAQWAHAAGAVDLPVAAGRDGVGEEGAPTAGDGAGEVVTTVIGEQCLGGAHPRRADQARRLAARAGVDLLAVRFGGAGPDAPFLGAGVWPDVADPAVADALDAWLAAGC